MTCYYIVRTAGLERGKPFCFALSMSNPNQNTLSVSLYNNMYNFQTSTSIKKNPVNTFSV